MTTDPELSVTSLLMLAAYLAFAGGFAGMAVSVRTLISLSLGRVCAQADEASRTATIASKFVGFIAISPTMSMLRSAPVVVSGRKRQGRQTPCLQDSPVRKAPIAAGEGSLRLRPCHSECSEESCPLTGVGQRADFSLRHVFLRFQQKKARHREPTAHARARYRCFLPD